MKRFEQGYLLDQSDGEDGCLRLHLRCAFGIILFYLGQFSKKSYIREGVQKKPGKSVVFCQNPLGREKNCLTIFLLKMNH